MLEFNGRMIKIEMDYNTMCVLEDMGLSFADFREKTLSMIRALIYIALKKVEPKITLEEVGKEISTFVNNGGNLEKIGEALQIAVEESGFFPKNNK